MNIFAKAGNFLKKNLNTPGDDFRQTKNDDDGKASKTVKVAAGAGAAIGAAGGGYAAYREISNNETFKDWVSYSTPKPLDGPDAAQVFGEDFSALRRFVRTQTTSGSSRDTTLQYLSYFKDQNPKMSTADLQSMYSSLEGQLGKDEHVREALNLISGHIERHGTTPEEAHAEFSSYFGYEGDFKKISQAFQEDQNITEDNLNNMSMEIVDRHSSPIGHLGMTKSVAIGIAGGALLGAGVGLAVGVGVNVVSKLLESGDK